MVERELGDGGLLLGDGGELGDGSGLLGDGVEREVTAV